MSVRFCRELGEHLRPMLADRLFLIIYVRVRAREADKILGEVS